MTVRDAIPVLVGRIPEDLPRAVTASATLTLRGRPVDSVDVDVTTDGGTRRPTGGDHR